MAFTPVPTLASGDLFTAAYANTYWKNNFAAGVPDLFTTKGDLAAASGADAADRLTAGADVYFIKTDSAQALGLAYGVLVAARQGGHATDWSSPGTTGYNPGKVVIHVGSSRWGPDALDKNFGTIVVSGLTGFTDKPIVITTARNPEDSEGDRTNACVIVDSSSQFTLYWGQAGFLVPAGTPIDIYWIAIGPG